MSNPLRSKKRGNTIIWILMGMLILGLGGFGASNFGGSVRSIGQVGDTDIDLRDYARALNREMAAVSAQIGQPVGFAQAQQLGIDRQVQAQVIASTALDDEAHKLGISVGDDEVRARVLAYPDFAGSDGKFDRTAYNLTLKREGLSEAEFETKLRQDAARTLLQGAALGATAAPETLTSTLTNWATETRDFALAELIAADLPDAVTAPSEEELQAYYDAHPEDFTLPESRRITYVWLSPEMLSDEVELDEDALRKAYQDRIGEFVTPERRLVERLVYPTEVDAKAAKARLDAGEVTFEALAAERGLSLTDIDLGEQSEADLGDAGPAVFAMTEPGVVGPLPSDLGPALFAMNGILVAQEVTFEEARDDLAAEAATDKARRVIADRMEGIEDLLASGATLEEVAAETKMQLGEIAFSAGTEDGIAAYSAFRDAAAAATAESFPTLIGLDDGGVFALRLDGIDPPALQPLDSVSAAVAEGWTKQETHDRLVSLAEEIQAGLANGAALESTGLVTTRYDDFARGGFIDGASAEVVQRAFALSEGESAVIDAEGKVFIVALKAIHPADPTDPDVARIRDGLEAQISQALAQDMFQLYVQAIEAEAGIRLDPAAINAVHAQMN
ncbi:MAG: SurA N-terminal domain-containing protein [Paracoccaceae bacterium]